MTIILEAAFWLCITLVVYPYLCYPILMRILAHIGSRTLNTIVSTASDVPKVTFIISAYNEAAVLPSKLSNALELDYPTDRLEIIVVSDASTDGTDEIVQGFCANDNRVQLIRQSERKGKSSGLNQGVAAARGDIIVFSDANSMYQPDAIRELIAPFSDPLVGYVVGAALYHAPGGQAGECEGIYWDAEMRLKSLESQFDSVVGGDGAIYAIRRHLFWNLREDDISDLVNPLQIIAAGYRGVFNHRAICYEHAGDTYEKEFRRKRRIVSRSMLAVWRYARSTQLRRRFLFMLYSHKVLRWFGVVTFGSALLTNVCIVLIAPSTIYVVTLAGLGLVSTLAVVGMVLATMERRLPRRLSLPYYFMMVNVAAILGILDNIRGRRYIVWDHIRQGGD